MMAPRSRSRASGSATRPRPGPRRRLRASSRRQPPRRRRLDSDGGRPPQRLRAPRRARTRSVTSCSRGRTRGSSARAETDWRLRADRVHHFVSVRRPSRPRHRGLGRWLLDWTEAGSCRGWPTAPWARPACRTCSAAGPTSRSPTSRRSPRRPAITSTATASLMIRSLDEPIPDLALPAGLEVRPVQPRDHRAIWDADCEAFQDHREPAGPDGGGLRLAGSCPARPRHRPSGRSPGMATRSPARSSTSSSARRMPRLGVKPRLARARLGPPAVATAGPRQRPDGPLDAPLQGRWA